MTGKEIAEGIDEIIKSLDKFDDVLKNEAINWGDLRCISVNECKCIYPEDDFEIVATVSEVAPESYKFAKVIQDKFKEKYNFDIEIKMEW